MLKTSHVIIAIWSLLTGGISKTLLCTNAVIISIKGALPKITTNVQNVLTSMTTSVSKPLPLFFLEKII